MPRRWEGWSNCLFHPTCEENIAVVHADFSTYGFCMIRPKNAFVLLRVLADSFGKAYVETALDT
jgi:hypothetical protein